MAHLYFKWSLFQVTRKMKPIKGELRIMGLPHPARLNLFQKIGHSKNATDVMMK
jgi:uracil-DNA glycosylase